MYAQQNGDMQSFRRGEYSIPANYRGNAFTLDEVPTVSHTEESEQCEAPTPQIIQSAPPKELSEARCADVCVNVPPKREGGLISDLLSRFTRGFELDDLLLIGLIILLLQNDCDRRDETVILLALLLLCGF